MTDEKRPDIAPGRPWRWRIAGWFGIRPAPDRKLRVRFRFRFFVFAFFGFLFVAALSLTSYSESPSFCRSCHIMEPYYQAWANSKHKEHAKCVDCHYPPGETKTIVWKKFQALSQVAKFVTRTYSSKPYAEVEDASCLRSGCHSTRLFKGRVFTEKGVRFDHKPHLEGERKGRQLRCTSCHSQVVVGKHIEVTYDTCYLCHLKDRKHGRELDPMGGCEGCHEVPGREIKVGNITYNHRDFLKNSHATCQSCHQDVIQGEGRVYEDRCFTCHNQPEKLEKFKDIPLMHDNHVTKHNVACFHCHQEIKHGKTQAGTKRLAYDCAVCHEDMHDLQRDLYRGVGARGMESMPSPMYLANVDCVACHLEKKTGVRGTTFEGSEKGCTECHGKEYTGVLGESHKATDGTVQELMAKLEAIVKGIPNPDPQLKDELADLRHNLAFVQNGHPVHNIYYSALILRQAHEKLTAISKKHKLDTPDTAALPIVTGQFCATLCHPRVGVKVPPETVKIKGKEMPHKKHTEDIACTTCHVFGQHKDVKLKRPTKCAKCHEEWQDE